MITNKRTRTSIYLNHLQLGSGSVHHVLSSVLSRQSLGTIPASPGFGGYGGILNVLGDECNIVRPVDLTGRAESSAELCELPRGNARRMTI